MVLYSWQRWLVLLVEVADVIALLITGRYGKIAIAYKTGHERRNLLNRYFLLNVFGLVVSVADAILTICLTLEVDMGEDFWLIHPDSQFYGPATGLFFIFVPFKICLHVAALVLSFASVGFKENKTVSANIVTLRKNSIKTEL